MYISQEHMGMLTTQDTNRPNHTWTRQASCLVAALLSAGLLLGGRSGFFGFLLSLLTLLGLGDERLVDVRDDTSARYTSTNRQNT